MYFTLEYLNKIGAIGELAPDDMQQHQNLTRLQKLQSAAN